LFQRRFAAFRRCRFRLISSSVVIWTPIDSVKLDEEDEHWHS
jgi:hypothetical protein